MSPDWTHYLQGMEIEVKCCEPDSAPVTVLTGVLTDQCALAGVLTCLFDAHYPLLSVEYLDDRYPQTDPPRSE
jgi:hypothetical protein